MELTEVIVYVRYSSMDKYPSKAFSSIEKAKKFLNDRFGFDVDNPRDEYYNSEIAEEWHNFEKGKKDFIVEEFEFHRVSLT